MEGKEQTEKKRSTDSIVTTPTMRRKAKLLSRCFITLLKCLTMCKKSKKNKNRAN